MPSESGGNRSSGKRQPGRPGKARRRPGKAAAVSADELRLDRELVRSRRMQRGLTQQALARQRVQLDGEWQQLSYAQIRRIESSGRCGPTSARILAALLGLELGALSPRDARELPCGLPREVSTDFVGRSGELERIVELLRASGAARVAVSIEGLPGMGKTELALQVCAVLARERVFRIFWFDAEDGDLATAWSDRVAPHLGIEDPDPARRAQLAVRAMEMLGEPVLLVLDNVESWSASSPGPRPRGSNLRWLITTRVRELGGREFQHVELAALAPAASDELMTRIGGPELRSRPGYPALLAELAGYTLPLELAAAFLRRFPDVDPREYLEALKTGRSDGLAAEIETRTLYGRTLERSLARLYECIPGPAQRAWRLAAWFEQAPASVQLSEACGLDRRLRAELRDFHLIQADSQGGWSMHRMTRAFGRASGSAQEREAARHAFVQGCVRRSLAIEFPMGFREYNADRGHLDAALELASEHPAFGPGEWAELQDRIGIAHCCAGNLASARQLHERALQADLNGFGAESAAVMRRRANLGYALLRLGEFERARQESESALDLGQRICPLDPQWLARIRSNLALILRQLGDLQRARELLEQALEADLAAVGEKNWHVSNRRNNLALVLCDLGELERAEQLWQQALAVELQNRGPLRAAARYQMHLGVLAGRQGDLAGARAALERALEWALACLGADHPDVAEILANLASALWQSGDRAGAMAKCEEALRVARLLPEGAQFRAAVERIAAGIVGGADE
jgi:tetratricopeptide (TPR) repeat protein